VPSQEYKDIVAMLVSMPDISDLTFQERRIEYEKRVRPLPVAEKVSCRPVSVGGIPGEWIVPEGAPDSKALLYLHGGGYCIGSIDTHRAMVSYIADATKVKTLLIEYRMAPENPFPAAVEDSMAAYEWLLSEGITAGDIVVAGDSAGGGLSVATLVSLKEKGLPLPAGAVLLSPWVDLTASGDSIVANATVDPLVTKKEIIGMAEAYLAGTDPRTPLASPLFADLAGLPPMLIHVGTAEILLDDATRLAEKASEAGVEVNLKKAEGMFHVWHLFASMMPEAREAVQEAADFIRKHLEE
jgi:monoterpene epsilon-lactone hydrolase